MCFFLDDNLIAERFWNKVDKTNNCWNWKAATSSKGYGRFKVGERLHSPHVLTYSWYYRDDPKGFDVCHLCGNPSCVNPKHLFKGSRSTNMMDALSKERIRKTREINGVRYARGEQIHQAKLNEHKVKLIKRRLENGDDITLIARDFEVDPSAIRQIKARKTWKHVD